MKYAFVKCVLMFFMMAHFASSSARDFRSADVQPLDYPTVQAQIYMGEIIRKETSGRYNIKVYGNSALGSEKEALDLVRAGALDIIRINTSTVHSTVPESMVLSFPFIFRDDKHFQKVMNGPVADIVLSSLEKEGLIGLVLWDSGTRSIYSKKPVKNVSDMKGMKIRVQASDLWTEFVKSMQAIPVALPTAEVYSALKSGSVDAAENNYSSYATFHHNEGAKYYSETKHVRSPEVLVFSKKVWDTLNNDEKIIIRKAARKSVEFYQEKWNKKQADSKIDMERYGSVFINDVDVDSFRLASRNLWDKFATTEKMKEIVRIIVQTK